VFFWKWKVILIPMGLGLILLVLFFTTGFFVIQPIRAVPDGMTNWYFRAGLNLGFIESADGILLDSSGKVSLFGRAAMGRWLNLSIIRQLQDCLTVERIHPH